MQVGNEFKSEKLSNGYYLVAVADCGGYRVIFCETAKTYKNGHIVDMWEPFMDFGIVKSERGVSRKFANVKKMHQL